MTAKTCPNCSALRFETVVKRASVPVHQNYLYTTKADALQADRGELDIQLCLSCGFIFNRAFDANKLNYSAQYENKQYCSPFFQNYLKERISYLLNIRQLRLSTIVEIGCGQGYFLSQLVKDKEAQNRGIGFDPSYRGKLEPAERLRFVRSFYDRSQSDVAPDVIISRHVIEHIPKPRQLLQQMNLALAGSSKKVQIYFETPCVSWILKHKLVWDFFYEHCSYFTQTTLSDLFVGAGYNVLHCEHIFEGQYLWLEAEKESSDSELASRPIREPSKELQAMARSYCTHEQALLQKWRMKLKTYTQRGGFAIWGAGAKGVTMCNLIDPHAEQIQAVIDINPDKQGHFVPGTGHPIVGTHRDSLSGIRTVLLMNPNYYQECQRLVQELGLSIDFILE